MVDELVDPETFIPDDGSLTTASMAFMEAMRVTNPAKAVELAIVAYQWAEANKVPLGDGPEVSTPISQVGVLYTYPSLNDLREFLDRYVKFREGQ